jgi:hypothetical protein
MGRGIAQVAAAAGHRVRLSDADAAVVDQARDAIRSGLARDVAKGRIDQPRADSLLGRIESVGATTAGLEQFRECGLVIEAVREDLSVKRALFAALEQVVSREAVLATNTSSLSVAAIGAATTHAGRVVGMHFFNPAPLMALVEIVPAITTAPEVAERTRALAAAWGKTTVVATDTPGFIVNRVARPFYGERCGSSRRARGRRHDRLGPSRRRRISHGTVRADGPHRQRRELRRHDQRVRRASSTIRATVRRSSSAASSMRSARAEARARLLRLSRLGPRRPSRCATPTSARGSSFASSPCSSTRRSTRYGCASPRRTTSSSR